MRRNVPTYIMIILTTIYYGLTNIGNGFEMGFTT